MTWRELSDLLHKERLFLHPRQVHEFTRTGETRLATFKRLEKSTRRAVDKAVREYAETGSWPTLTDEQILILHYRLFYGRDLATALSNCTTNLFPPQPDCGGNMIQWVLCEAWEYPGLPHTLCMSFDKLRSQTRGDSRN